MPNIVLFSDDEYLIRTYQKSHKYFDDLLYVESYDKLLECADEETHILYDYEGNSDEVAEIASRSKVFVLAYEPSFREGTKLLNLGIKGYANRYIAPLHLQEALAQVDQGNIWLYPEFIQEMIQSLKQPEDESINVDMERLTSKEQDVAKYVADGLSNKEIAYKMDITVRTVKAHLSSIFEKLDVHDRLSLALKIK
jgi:DNA-binding NarL/FixJ family response regulator